MSVYVPHIVQQLKAFYGDLLYDINAKSIRSYLDKLAVKMHEGLLQKERVIFQELNNYHPNFLGAPIASLQERTWAITDCRYAIANEYGFKTWEKVPNSSFDIEFEEAVNHLLAGNLEALKISIAKKPGLIGATSTFGHQATLLHYCGSNGVEFWRQQVPEKLPEIVRFLLSAGADKEAKMLVYGGAFTTLQLMETSAHPKQAGLTKVLATILK